MKLTKRGRPRAGYEKQNNPWETDLADSVLWIFCVLYDDFNFETCHALPALIRRVVERQSPVEIWGSGEDRKDWLHVNDLVDACFLAMDKLTGYEALNVGSGQAYSLNELLKIIMELDNYKSDVVHKLTAVKLSSLTRKFDVDKAERKLGYCPKIDIRKGLRSTIEWYKKLESS